ncbi:MAG: hypothetical protein ACKVW3_08160 [Phycisphaerales bacterium]
MTVALTSSAAVPSESSMARASLPCDAPPHIGPTRIPRWLLAACGMAIIISLSFALAPLPRPHVETPALDTPAPAVGPTRIATLDVDAFRAPIWVADPPPPVPPPSSPPATPPPPVRLQLLAIIREPGPEASTIANATKADAAAPWTYRATLYDPDTDRLYVVAAGDVVGTRTVERVDADEVRLSDAAGSRTLSLRYPPRDLPQGGGR